MPLSSNPIAHLAGTCAIMIAMKPKLTRRELSAAVLAVATASAAQQPTPPPEDVNTLAKLQVERNAAQLAKIPIAMNVEPAFAFKA